MLHPIRHIHVIPSIADYDCRTGNDIAGRLRRGARTVADHDRGPTGHGRHYGRAFFPICAHRYAQDAARAGGDQNAVHMAGCYTPNTDNPQPAMCGFSSEGDIHT